MFAEVVFFQFEPRSAERVRQNDVAAGIGVFACDRFHLGGMGQIPFLGAVVGSQAFGLKHRPAGAVGNQDAAFIQSVQYYSH